MGDGINEYTTTWRGDRSAQHDYFDDILGAPQTPGNMFADSEGLRDYDKVTSGVADDGSGISVTTHCRRCRCQGAITFPWDELLAIYAYPETGVVPQGYQRSTRPENHGAVFPTTCQCPCGAKIAPLIDPGEAKQLLDQYMRSGQYDVRGQLDRSPLAQQVFQRLQQRQQRVG